MAVTKRCPTCGDIKSVDEFPPNRSTKDGLASCCRNCKRIYDRRYAEKNKERLAIYRKKRYEENREEILKKQSIYGKEHRAEITARRREYHRAYNQKHRGERNAYNREWRKINKDRLKQRKYGEGVRYRAKHKDEIRKKKQSYENKRRLSDPIFKLKSQVRTMIRDSFRRKGLKKSDNTEKILGCSLIAFQEHLLQTWKERYGVAWNGEDCHIDHIVPLATAKTEEDIIRLCHYTNLQLLTPSDNFEKGGHYERTKIY